jgi:hypothetical protein
MKHSSAREKIMRILTVGTWVVLLVLTVATLLGVAQAGPDPNWEELALSEILMLGVFVVALFAPWVMVFSHIENSTWLFHSLVVAFVMFIACIVCCMCKLYVLAVVCANWALVALTICAEVLHSQKPKN